jgi:soluble lytic murein transglycosylase-like protein
MSGTRGRAAAPEFTARVLPDVVQPSGGGAALVAAQQMDSIGDRILRLSESQGRRADQQATEAATDAGLAAGNSAPGTHMEGGGDLYRRAYNRAALQGASWRLEATARTELDRMGREHQANPAGFTSAFTAWRDGTLEGMPESFRARLAPTLDAMAGQYTRAIQEQNDRSVADEAGAAFTAVLPARLASIERLGLRAATDPAARAELDREQQALRNDLVALGPRNAFTFEGVEYPADPTRRGRYTVEQLAQLRTSAQDTEVIAAARGAFRTGPQTLAAVEDFERRAEAGEIPGLRPDQARRMADSFRRDISQARAAQTEGQREARAALAGRLDADRAAIAERGEPVSNVLDTELAAAGYDVAQYRGQERARMLGWQATNDLRSIDTPERAQEVAERFQPGTDLFRADPTTARQVLEFARQRGATIRAATLQDTVRDRAAELQTNAAQAVRHARAVPQEWRPIVTAAAQQHGLPEFLALALLGRESGGRAGAVSPAGAIGPAQIMPDTAASPGLGMAPLPREALTDPARAIPWAFDYYRRLLTRYQGNHEHALMAYNWGFGSVDRWIAGGRTGAVPRETREYVAALLPAAGGDPSSAGWQPPSIVTREEALAAGQTPNGRRGFPPRPPRQGARPHSGCRRSTVRRRSARGSRPTWWSGRPRIRKCALGIGLARGIAGTDHGHHPRPGRLCRAGIARAAGSRAARGAGRHGRAARPGGRPAPRAAAPGRA